MAAKKENKEREEFDKRLEKLEKQFHEEHKEEDIYTNILEKTKHQAVQKTKFLQSQFKEHSSTAIIAALSFVIGLTWKDFIVKIVDNILRPHLVQKYPYLSELITAVAVTIFAVVVMAFVSKWVKKPVNGDNNLK